MKTCIVKLSEVRFLTAIVVTMFDTNSGVEKTLRPTNIHVKLYNLIHFLAENLILIFFILPN